MNRIIKKPLHNIGYDFIVPPYLPEGKDEYYLRNSQLKTQHDFRGLTAHEIEVLVKNENQADNWNDIFVSEKFDPRLVKNCRFHGMIRIGALESYYLEYHELQLPVGLYNSTIVACDIGDNVVIMNVDYLAHYQIGNEVILFNINEMHSTNHAKFGNGIVKDGEEEDVRIWLELANENGGRKLIPFDGITPADAYMWVKFRDDPILLDRFKEMTEQEFDAKRGYYGTVGDRTVIKNTRILKDVKIGSDAYIKGGNKLKNLTINSNAQSPSQIGEGVEMVNGIMNYGSRAFYGVKAVRFIMGENTCLKYGARLINSYLGDNSTISCCEVLNSLIFPSHEQHHNNSFLCAAIVMGQSNIAAGATLGSNHNSRGADGEMVAGRGFWPALCVNIKHNSRFASYVLLAKGAYPAELHIPYPFSLVSNTENALQIMPAYWMMYNMYALTRNAWKYGARDKRMLKQQEIVFDYLAPDTISEMFDAMKLISIYIAKAYLNRYPDEDHNSSEDLEILGRTLIHEKPELVDTLEVLGEMHESSKRKSIILKARKAFLCYRDMIHYYAVKTLIYHAKSQHFTHWKDLTRNLEVTKRGKWMNLGGQLICHQDLEHIKTRIRERSISTWAQLHQQYHEVFEKYPIQNTEYALASLLELHHKSLSETTEDDWQQWLSSCIDIQKTIERRTIESRDKDYQNPFRKLTYDSVLEMEAVLGRVEDNNFIQQVHTFSEEFIQLIQSFNKHIVTT